MTFLTTILRSPSAASPNLRPRLLALLCAGLLGAAACDDTVGPVTTATFDLSSGAATTDLYAIPFPNDFRRDAQSGAIDLAHLARIGGPTDLIQQYITLAAAGGIGGFALNGGVYFRFDGPIDPRCLPASPAASAQPGASVFLVNISKGSARYGVRVPLQFTFFDKPLTYNFGKDARGTYLEKNSLAVLPVAGFPLDPATTYAAVITEGLCDTGGTALGAALDFLAVMADSAPDDATLKRAHTAYAPLRAYLKDKGITGVVSAAVFTTGKAVDLAARARKVALAGAAPLAKELEARTDGPNYYELRGKYDAPYFQHGTPPFLNPSDGGGFKLDASGDPTVAKTETLRFALSVPKATMPAAGYPLVIYAHGTGGDYRTFIRNYVAEALAEVKDASGKVLANMAVIGIDQVLHGDRGSSATAELTFFNFLNPVAAVHNMIQSGVDDYSLLRLAKGLTASSVKWSDKSTHAGKTLTFSPDLKFDPTKIYFMGHSQGGITGPIFLAHEPGVKGGVLSASGGLVALTLLEKLDPLPIKPEVAKVLGVDEEELSRYHPMISLVQQILEPADPINYARLIVPEPPTGAAPKHIFLSQGVIDLQTPNVTSDALATAMEVPLVGPKVREVASLALRGLKQTSAPLAGNVQVGSAKATAGLLQYNAVPANKSCTTRSDCSRGDYCQNGQCLNDGHYVLFQDTRGKRQYQNFLGTMVRDGTPTIVP